MKHDADGSIHTCDWCDHMLACEKAQAGTGYLWICDRCATSRLELSRWRPITSPDFKAMGANNFKAQGPNTPAPGQERP